jgi:hypothetical protein
MLAVEGGDDESLIMLAARCISALVGINVLSVLGKYDGSLLGAACGDVKWKDKLS